MSSLASALSPANQARLKACITPSRACIPPARGGKKQKKGDAELPDFKAPEPKTASELKEWDRMASRMEGEVGFLIPGSTIADPQICRVSLVLQVKRTPRSCSQANFRSQTVRSAFQQVWIMADKVGPALPLRDYLDFAEELEQRSSPSVLHLLTAPSLISSRKDLAGHHGIEERYIFPVLAKRMPEFALSGSAEHIEEHHQIHAGLLLPSSTS